MIRNLIITILLITVILFFGALAVIYFLNPASERWGEGVPKQLRVESEQKSKTIFKEDFESGNLRSWTGKRAIVDGRTALALVAVPENKYFGMSAVYDPEKKIMPYSAGLELRFKYFAKSGSFVYVSFLNETKDDNYHYYLRGIKTGKWVDAAVPLRYFSDNEFKGKPLSAGDVITKLNFFAGTPGETAAVYIDDVEIGVISGTGLPAGSPDQAPELKKFTEDFESPDVQTRWNGTLDSELPAGRQGHALLALPARDKYFDVVASLNSSEVIFVVGKDSAVEFEYYIDQPVNIYVSLFNLTKNDNFHFEVHVAVPNSWQKAKIPFNRLVDNSFKGVPIETGDKIGDVKIYAGRPGSSVSLWVDDILISSQEPSEGSSKELSEQAQAIVELPARQFARYEYINRAIIANLRKKYNSSNRPKSILNLGDSISKSMAFVWPMRYSRPGMLINEGYEYIDKDTAAAESKTSSWGREIVDKALKSSRPETVTILFGTNDASTSVYTGSYFANMEYIVQACLDNGSVPVLFTIPPFGSVPAEKLENYNYQIRTIAMEKQVPLCDLYRLFIDQPDWKQLLFDGVHPNFFEDGSKVGGYNLINDIVFEVYKILERDVMLRPEQAKINLIADNFDSPSTSQAQILFYFNFEDGNQGFIGEPVSDISYKNSVSALELVAGDRELEAQCDIQFKVTPATYISVACYAVNCPRFRIQLVNKTQNDNFWAAKEDVPEKKWVRYFFDLNKDFVDNENTGKQIFFDDLITSLRVFGIKLSDESRLIIDDLEIYNASDKTFHEELTAQFDQLKKQIKAGLADITGGHPLIDKINSLSKEISLQLPKASGEDLSGLKDKIDILAGLKDKLYFLNQMQAVFADNSPSLGIGYASPMVRISPFHKQYPFKGKVTSSINILSARHEYENFQLYLVPFLDKASDVDIKFNDLTHQNGKDIFPAQNFRWFIEGFVTTKQSFPVAKYRLGKKTDPLLPGTKFSLGYDQPVWINVYVPSDQEPGTYKGSMSVIHGSGKEISLNITLKVWDFQIPLAGRLHSPTTLDLFMIQDYYKTALTQEKRRQWYKFCLDYRIDPTSLYHYGLSPKAEDLDFCEKLGLRTIVMGGNHDQPDIHNSADVISYYKIVKEKNLLYKSMLFITDKFGDSPEMYQRAKDKSNWVKQNCPGLLIFAGISPREPLFGYVDIWDPIINDSLWGEHDVFLPDVCADRQKKGEKIMWYVAASPWYPYPNVMIDNDLIESRIIFWMTWKNNIDGFEYYYFNLWGRNMLGRDAVKKWPDVEWDTYAFSSSANSYNGDGQLVYPGPDMNPYGSIRLENIRDGIEDYEMLNLLSMYVEKTRQIAGSNPKVARLINQTEKIIGVPENIIKNLYIFTRDPEAIDALRKEIGDLLELYKKAIEVPRSQDDKSTKSD